MTSYQSFNKSLLFKIITMFMCVLLPAYCCIGIFFYQINGIIRKNVFDSTQRRVEHELSTLQSMFQQIASLQQEYINDLDLYSMALGNQFFSGEEAQRAIVRLQTRLANVRNSEPLAAETFVYIFSLKLLVSATTAQTAEPPFDIESLIVKDATSLARPKLLSHGDQFYLITMNPEVCVNANPFFLIYTRINQEDISAILNGMQFPASSTLLLLDNELGLFGMMPRENKDMLETYLSLINQEKIEIVGGFIEQDLFIVSDWIESPGLALVVLYPERVAMKEFNQMRNLTLFILAFVSALAVLFAFGVYHMVYKPLSILKKAFADVDAGHEHVHISFQASDEFCDIYDQFNNMVDRLHVLIRRVYQQELENKRSELKQLQSQINPHFLYNCFFIIYRLSKMEDMDTLADFSRHMGEYFQYVTRNKTDVVELSAEIKHAQDYVHIQDIRFSNRIDVDFSPLDAQFADLPVPRFILQPILENCYEHGFARSAAGGIIRVRYIQDADVLQIIVSNSGDSMSPQKCSELQRIMDQDESSAECTGIVNVSRRLMLMYRQNGLLRIQPGDGQGVVVTIRIPLKGECADAEHAHCR